MGQGQAWSVWHSGARRLAPCQKINHINPARIPRLRLNLPNDHRPRKAPRPRLPRALRSTRRRPNGGLLILRPSDSNNPSESGNLSISKCSSPSKNGNLSSSHSKCSRFPCFTRPPRPCSRCRLACRVRCSWTRTTQTHCTTRASTPAHDSPSWHRPECHHHRQGCCLTRPSWRSCRGTMSWSHNASPTSSRVDPAVA